MRVPDECRCQIDNLQGSPWLPHEERDGRDQRVCRRPWRELLQTRVGQARPLALHPHGSLASETFSTSRECVWAGATHLGSADAPEPAQVFNTD